MRKRYTLTPYKLEQVAAYMQAHIDEPITLATLAAIGGRMSQYHFARCFRQSTGLPPYRYLTHYRLAWAKHLLTETDLPIAQVGLTVGIRDQPQFTQLFRKYEATTPQRFRARGNGN